MPFNVNTTRHLYAQIKRGVKLAKHNRTGITGT